jgi:hypothetical protein
MPVPGATHETAQQVNRDCRVVYADNDPVVLANARALLTPAQGGMCDHIEADVRDPAALLASAAATLDFSEPVAVLLLAILHFIPDEGDPAGIVATLAAGLAPGSLVAISHVTADYAPGAVTAAIAAYNERMHVPLYARDRAGVSALFGDLPVRWPGVVPVTRWRPSSQETPGRPVDIYGGIAKLPGPGDHHESSAAFELAAPLPAFSREPDELTARAAEFPGHRISRETIQNRTRYIARGTHLGSRPHTVVTDSAEELFAELAVARHPQPHLHAVGQPASEPPPG